MPDTRPHLASPRTDELIDDDLSAIAEVAELSFPNGQAARFSSGETVFESHDGLFRQHGVGHRELRLIGRQMLAAERRYVRWLDRATRHDDGRSAAAAILSRQRDRETHPAPDWRTPSSRRSPSPKRDRR